MTDTDLIAFEDPNHPGNQPTYHTGKPCITRGCDKPAGTWWSPLWCFDCNVARMRRISEQFEMGEESLGRWSETPDLQGGG